MIVLLIHAGVTLAMFGVILVVQVVHYPLFRHVGDTSFPTYEAEHVRRITWVVAPLMGIELVTAGLLVWTRPAGVSVLQVGLGGGLVLVLWIVTALVQVPLHQRLAQGFARAPHRRLVRSNWVRTALWAARSGVVLWMLHAALRS